MRLLAALFAFLSALAVTFALLIMPRLPVNWIPWKTPDLDAAPTPLAHIAINHLKANAAMCRAALAETAQLRFTYRPDRDKDGDCGYKTVVTLTDGTVPLIPAPDMTCSLAAAFAWWQRDVRIAARVILHTTVAKIEHVGTFSCRNVNAEQTGRRSQHATASAIDISAFVLSDGRRIAVSQWTRPGPEAEFLRAARRDACRYFNGVLSPDYNALHAAHFHLDLGPYLICR